MWRPLQDGQTPRPLQENATTNPWPHVVHRPRAKQSSPAQIGIHAEIEILGKSHIAMCCQGDGPDHQRPHPSRLENAGDLLGSPNHLIGIGHWSRLAGAGWSDANRRPNPKAALTLSSTVMRRTRTISACRDALWLTLGRSRGKDGSSDGWFTILT
jgi:hypothetical protein